MSRQVSALLVGVTVALAALLTACAARRATTPAQHAPHGTPSAAEHVYRQPIAPAPTPTHPTTKGDPRIVALAEARAVCNFDWHQSLAARIAAARAFATTGYAGVLTPTADGVANWRRTQQDRESATCVGATTVPAATAPNSGTVRYERVRMTQVLRVNGRRANEQPFVVLYRVERQYDGRWLVGAEGDGG
jgi:hypothetical protein